MKPRPPKRKDPKPKEVSGPIEEQHPTQFTFRVEYPKPRAKGKSKNTR